MHSHIGLTISSVKLSVKEEKGMEEEEEEEIIFF